MPCHEMKSSVFVTPFATNFARECVVVLFALNLRVNLCFSCYCTSLDFVVGGTDVSISYVCVNNAAFDLLIDPFPKL